MFGLVLSRYLDILICVQILSTLNLLLAFDAHSTILILCWKVRRLKNYHVVINLLGLYSHFQFECCHEGFVRQLLQLGFLSRECVFN